MRVRDQVVTNQFGTLRLDVNRPARLLVPTAKSLIGPPASPVGGMLDHFQCYKVKRARGERFAGANAAIETQFESASITLVKPLRLCTPTSKNGEDPSAATHADHLLCYRIKARSGAGTVDVGINNQFGPQSYRIGQFREFCVPSSKSLPYGSPSRAFLARTASS